MSEAKQAFTEAYDWYQRYAKSRSERDREAFYSAYWQAVIHFVRRHTPPASQMGTYVATDFVKDTFLKLDKEAIAGKEFASAEDLQRYALRVIKNCIFDYLRSKQARHRMLDPRSLEDIPIADPVCEAAFLHLETMVRIAEAVKDLERFDPRAARIADLFIYGAQDKEEIASNLQISTKTVNRVLIKLRARLQTD